MSTDTVTARTAACRPLAGLRIGLDLDNTLVCTLAAFAAYVERALGRTVNPDPPVYDLVQAGWFPTIEALKVTWHAAVLEGLYETATPYPGAPSALQSLVAAGASIVVVTARHPREREVTVRSLDRIAVPYEAVHFTADKWQVPADVYLDDNPSVLAGLDRRGIPRLARSHWYNRHCGGARFSDWEQVPALVARAAGAAP